MEGSPTTIEGDLPALDRSFSDFRSILSTLLSVMTGPPP